MKGPYCLIILILLLAACSNPDNKKPANTIDLTAITKKTAKEYLAKNSKYLKNYQPIAFGGLDSIVESHLNNKNYIQLGDSIMEIEAIRFREMGENWKLFLKRKESGFYENKQARFKKSQDSIARLIVPKFTGYTLEHRFKTTDSTGEVKLNKYVFCFDEQGELDTVLR